MHRDNALIELYVALKGTLAKLDTVMTLDDQSGNLDPCFQATRWFIEDFADSTVLPSIHEDLHSREAISCPGPIPTY